MQAPVSDRQYHENHSMSPPELKVTLEAATAQIKAGNGQCPLSPDCLKLIHGEKPGPPEPLTAERWHSLAAKGGFEDFFSSDLSNERLAEVFGPFKKHQKICCLILCNEDQAYPDFVDKHKLLKRFEQASGASTRGNSHSVVLPGANHQMEAESGMNGFVDCVTAFIQDLP